MYVLSAFHSGYITDNVFFRPNPTFLTGIVLGLALHVAPMRLRSMTMIAVDPHVATVPAAMLVTETDTVIDLLPDVTITMTDGVIAPLPAAVPLMTTLLPGEVVMRSPIAQLASILLTRMSMDDPPTTVARPHLSFPPVTTILVRATPRVTTRVAPTSCSCRMAVRKLLPVTILPRGLHTARLSVATLTAGLPTNRSSVTNLTRGLHMARLPVPTLTAGLPSNRSTVTNLTMGLPSPRLTPSLLVL